MTMLQADEYMSTQFFLSQTIFCPRSPNFLAPKIAQYNAYTNFQADY